MAAISKYGHAPTTVDYAASLTDDQLDHNLHSLISLFLKEKQVLFCEYRSMGMPVTKAAKAAGYLSASSLTSDPAIVSACALMREQNSRAARVTIDWRKLKLREIVERSMAQDPPQWSAANTAIKTLNDMDHDEKIQLTVEHGINQMLAKLNVDPRQDLALMGKLFHTINLSDEDFNVIDN